MELLAIESPFNHLTMKERNMVPTRKITEVKVKFSGISEIYPRLYVFQISWEHPDKRASSMKEERGWWRSLFPKKMGEGNLSSLVHFL